MSRFLLLLIPIAASNSFGFVRYFLISSGALEQVDDYWRGIVFILSIVLTLSFYKTKNVLVGYFCIGTLLIGSASSIGGIWLGAKTGSDMAIGLGVIWFLGFSWTAYKLFSFTKAVPNA